MPAGQTSTIQSLKRGITILESFTLEKPERGVLELSREMGLHKSTVSRLMRTLERGNLLSRNPENQRYQLGLGLVGMAGKVILFRNVREISRPFLRELSTSCRETVTLTVLDVDNVVNLEQFVPPTRRVTNYGEVGLKAPPHCAAAGKVLLAYLPEADVDRFLSGELERFTANTITDPEELRRVLALVRKQGYATAQEELEEGLNVVAAPVHENDGQVRAAVCIAGPASRVTPERFPALAAKLKVVATRISQQVGYPGDAGPSAENGGTG